MKFTRAWLDDHLETELSCQELADRLITLGLEVEGLEDPAAALAGFVTARVVAVAPHPGADTLRLCTVACADGSQPQVVCGAPNVHAGMVGVYAPAGVTMPDSGEKLKARAIRGVPSQGMLCSERELKISDEHDRIIALPSDTALGLPYATLLGRDDPVFSLAITPNRSDCFSLRGIARDLAAAGAGRLKPWDFPLQPDDFPSPRGWHIAQSGDAQRLCPLVLGRSFRIAENPQSPPWLRHRLQAIGLRPISALVDITNYVTFDLGRPVHVYDADRLAGDLTMRLARAGETLAALNHETYHLTPETLVIADEKGPQALGGLIGGSASGCSAATRSVFLEVALFSPSYVALAGRRLGITSDARIRFERGVDPLALEQGVAAVSALIARLCGGQASAIVRAGRQPAAPRVVTLARNHFQRLSGCTLAAEKQQKWLEALGFTVTPARDGGDGASVTPMPPARDGAVAMLVRDGESVQTPALRCQVPSWRPDIKTSACLVEEILRLEGIAAVAEQQLTAPPIPPAPPGFWQRAQRIRRSLAAIGLYEVTASSFVEDRQAQAFESQHFVIDNPAAAQLNALRPRPLAALLVMVARNHMRGFRDLALFELGPAYAAHLPARQEEIVTLLRSGAADPAHWRRPPRRVDLYDLKADCLHALAAAGVPTRNLSCQAPAPAWYHPGLSGSLMLGRKVLAHFGQLDPALSALFELEIPVMAAEIPLAALPPAPTKTMRAAYKSLTLQPLRRDFAFIAPRNLSAQEILHTLAAVDRKLIVDIGIFDLYQGKSLGAQEQALAVTMTLQPHKTSLTETELSDFSARVIARAASLGLRLRT